MQREIPVVSEKTLSHFRKNQNTPRGNGSAWRARQCVPGPTGCLRKCTDLHSQQRERKCGLYELSCFPSLRPSRLGTGDPPLDAGIGSASRTNTRASMKRMPLLEVCQRTGAYLLRFNANEGQTLGLTTLATGAVTELSKRLEDMDSCSIPIYLRPDRVAPVRQLPSAPPTQVV